MAENIQVKITGDSTSFVNAAGRAEKAAGGLSAEVANMAKNMAGTLTVGIVTSQLVSAQREFDRLNSSLITVTGSSAAAEREMAWLKNFAKETPFGLAQATEAFVKMKALGLDPTRASLTSFGNTASAMGKDLMQFVEAVADASTGEFERLKEFGITSKKQGDQVALTFKGVTTTVKNSSDEIVSYLERIGNVDFAGAAILRGQTLDGQISALGDSWNQLLLTVNSGNVGGLMADSVTLASNAVTDLTTIIGAMNAATRENTQETGAMAAAQEGLATVFETVAVLAANTSYVLTGVGREIGGIAAQAALLLQGDFSGAARVREMMIADGQKAREEVDKLSQRILGARDAAAATAPAIDGVSGSIKRMSASSAGAGAGSAALKQAQAEARDLQKLLADIETKKTADQSGLSESTVKALTTLGVQLDKVQISAEQYNAAMSDLLDQDGELAKEQAEITKYLKERHDWLSRLAMDQYAAAENTRKSNTSLQEEIDTLGMSAEQLAQYRVEKLNLAAASETTAAAELDEAASRLSNIAGMGDIVDQYRALAAAKRESAAATAATAGLEQEKFAREQFVQLRNESDAYWSGFASELRQSATDALTQGLSDGGQSGGKLAREKIVQTLKAIPIKLVVDAAINLTSSGLSSLLGGSGSSSASSGGAGLLNSVSNLFSAGKGAYSLYSSGAGGTMGAYVQGLGNLVGSSTLSAYGTGMGLSTLQAESAALAYEAAAQSTGQAIYSEIATSILEGAEAGAASSGLAGGAMTAMGYAGAFMAAVGLLFNDWDSGGAPKTKFRGWGSISDGKVLAGELGNPLGEYTGGRTDRDYVHEVIDGLLNDAFVASLQKINADYDASAYLGGMINWQGKSSNQMSAKAANAQGELIYAVSREKGQGTKGWESFLNSEGPRLQAALMFDAMRTESEDYAAIVAATVGPTTDLTSALKDLSSEGITQLTGQVYDMISLFEQFNEQSVFSADIAADQFISLTKAAGGADKLSELTSAYMTTAYTEQELFERQFSTLKTKLEDGFDSLILNIPTDPIEIQGMISNIDLSTTAGKTAMDQIAQQLAGVQAEKPATVAELQAAIAQAGLGTEAGSGMLQDLIKEVGAVVVAKQSEGGLSTLSELKALTKSANVTISDPGMANISDLNLQNALVGEQLAKLFNSEETPGITNYVNGLATTGAGTSPGGVDEYLVMLSDSTQDFNNLVAGLDASTTAGKAIFEALAGGIQNLGVAAPQTTEELASLAAGLDLNTTAGQAIMDAIGQGLGEIGVAMPATVEEFNKLVEATYKGGKINEEAFLSLMNLYEDFQAMTETISGFGDVRQGIIDSYKTEAEKQADLQATLVEAFGKVNEAVPQTVDQFVALALKADPATESGRALISTLQQVQEAFDQTASYGQKFALSRIEFNVGAFQDLAQSGLSYLQSAAELESQRAQAAQQAAQESISSINSIVSSLSSAAQDMYSNVGSTAGFFAAQASAKLDEMLATAQTTGYLPEQNTLNTAIQAARAGLTRENFASQYDYERAQLVLAGKLTQLQELSAAQLPAAEQALNVANSQLTAAQQALDYYEQQVNLLLGIEESSWSLTGSIEEIGAAILESLNNQGKTIADSIIAALAAGRIGAADAATQLGGLGYTDTLKNGIAAGSNGAVIAGGSLYAANGWTGSVDSARRIVAEAFGAMDPADFYSAALSVGLSGRMIEQMYDMPAGTAAAWAKANNLPAFAVGTDYVPQDMLALVHQGEAITPVAYRGEQEKLLSSLIAEVQALRARLDDVAESTQSTAQAVNGRGRAPMLVETA